ISQEANRLRGIVNKILSFSKMEAGKIRYNLEKSDLNEIVEEVLKSYSFHLKNKNFEYTFEACSDLPEIQSDKDALSEAIINLIDNAIKYSNGEKRIELHTGVDSGYAYFEVVDYGIGISRMDQKNVFDKFYRVPSGAIHNTKGTGLGLTLVKHIMEAHGGKIELVSQVGKGSSFRLKFPLNSQSPIHI
ncbi:MAG: sensor histidine kinase, partial [Cyclobacteriaceae bacterium]